MHLVDSSASVFVAGHRGLVGSAVVRALRKKGYSKVLEKSRAELDLLDQHAVFRFFEAEKPEFVVLAAAKVGGILANNTFPADFISDNLVIETNIIRAAHEAGVKRLIFLGSSCIYPKLAPQPLKEAYLLTAPLEPTNEWYAVAKIAGIKLCQAYHKQFGDDFLSLMPTNLYGPGDNFDLQNSHVLPALIRKFHEAKGLNGASDQPVTLWGTGKPRREFLYSDDLADAVVFALTCPTAAIDRVAPDRILNVGYGNDVYIAELAEIVRDVVGSQSPILYDATKPDGTPRKLMDSSRMTELGWKPSVSLPEGLKRVYQWYREQMPPVEVV